ncbi:endolytic transglycosylase MltG [Streptomyces sp. NA02950]|uniref:endolytic transglycosylase MltG n=1 Tax=Streptomyces sp. NA02950 TaxID=2742137 RepID=UPI001590E8E8|nr:endolytic transglycosylase MltG [Streptomyces sp. NA02950]QKV91596.1 endolytic transglycosylase MltG [Streptomyces sp. NA02950]
MTEYGRGSGSQPWHPEDPLYGDQGWGHQAVTGQDPHSQAPYGQDSYAQDPYGQGGHGQGGYGQDPYGQDSYGQDSYAQGPYGQDPYGHQRDPHGYPQDPQQFQQFQHPQQSQWDGQNGGYPQQQPRNYAGGGWEGTYGDGLDPHDPYARPADPYGGGQGAPAPGDYYAQDGYQQQVPQAAPQTQAMPRIRPEAPRTQQMRRVPQEPAAEEPAADEPAGREEDHPFFQDGKGSRGRIPSDDMDAMDDGDDDADGDERRGKKGGSGKPAKRRSGVACLFVTVALVGVVGGGGYFAYDFWQSRFGPAPDYSGAGAGSVSVEIPEGSGGATIGDILTNKGVVKSSRAFVKAVEDSGKVIQPGSYTLHKEMSGAAAVKMMTDPTSSNALIVTEGMRNATVYAAMDKKIGLKSGTTAGIAKKEAKNLGLPSWADGNAKIKDPLEGFLYPSRYSVGEGAKPKDILRKMVALARQNYAKQDLEGKAKELGLKSPLQLITVASLVQAEGVTHSDFRKMSEVVYNRLKPGNTETNGKLEFDSTYNYIKNQSKIDIPINEIKKYNNPYNTYFYAGLPPGPIGNPGEDALKAAMNPTDDGWYYFISLDGKTSQFSKTYAEHQKWVDKFNRQRKNDG